ncbi:MAG: type II toxin-antitoxin system Phd/YefM family antitoxin [Gemmatimonadaceae bacterium]
MISTGIRDLKNNLSRYIRQVEAGERIMITDHGRVVAQLAPPEGVARPMRYDELVAAGVIRPPKVSGLPLGDILRAANICLPPGTAAALIDEDRGEV